MHRCFYFRCTNSEVGKEMRDWIVVIPDYVNYEEVMNFIFDLRDKTIYRNRRYIARNEEGEMVGSEHTGEYFASYARNYLKEKYNAMLFTELDGMIWM